jgi:carboxyl-terminal processing protease
MERGLDLERKRSWAAAIRFYENALEQWPSRAEFGHRLRLCEMHFRIVRRYQDRSFREVLLKLSRDRAMDLFEELLDRIESHYVEPVGLDPIVRRGLDNLEVALRDPTFLKTNATTAETSRVNWLRQALRQRRDALDIPSRQAARAEVGTACDLARHGLGIEAAPVILEFIYGACDVLDPYSSYLSPDKLDDMFTMIDGNFVGLGVELKADEQGLRLVGVIKGGPAADAGLKSGDKIVAVNGRPTKGMGLDESAGLLQGPAGSVVEISVLHEGKTRSYHLARRHVEVASVTDAKIVDRAAGIGYVHLTGFQKTSVDELDRAISGLQKQGMRYLVLDLRGNPGGLLNVAVEIADRFVDRGVIVSTRGRAPGQTQTYRARPEVSYSMPMAVLIDRDSASASEILAGALKDLHRAVVVGDRSYGKGSVQSIYELRSAPAGLKLTTAQFYSPTGRAYSEQGVDPDTMVRTAAKPTIDRLDDEDHTLPFTLGDAEEDPVLRQAVAQVKQKSLTAR